MDKKRVIHCSKFAWIRLLVMLTANARSGLYASISTTTDFASLSSFKTSCPVNSPLHSRTTPFLWILISSLWDIQIGIKVKSTAKLEHSEDTFKTEQNSTVKRRKNPNVNTMFGGAVSLIPEWCMLAFGSLENCIESIFSKFKHIQNHTNGIWD